MDKILSFPRIGNYDIPIKRLIKRLLPNAKVLTPSPLSANNIERGFRNSPDLVCAPFKFNMGNFLEALDSGANILIQTGTGCRFGYYGELQELILKNLGYDFKFYCFNRGNTGLKYIYNTFKTLGCSLSLPRFFYELSLTVGTILLLDHFESKMRKYSAFETVSGSFKETHQKLLNDIEQISGFFTLFKLYIRYNIHSIKIKRPKKYLKIGIIGELFTLMEPESNHNIEERLIKRGISVTRKMSASFLLMGRHKKSPKYLKYNIGANGGDSVYQAIKYAKKGYDGLIHMKSFGCAPEINAMPALRNICKDYKIPILYLSFDGQHGDVGLDTRIEAFTDMLAMKRGDIFGSLSGDRCRLRFD